MPPAFDVEGRVAAVTGASSGLGARFARVLAAHGARVVLAARREERIAALAAEIGAERAVAVPADVTDEAALRSVVDTAVQRFGGLDVLVNNAGISRPARAVEESTESFREVLEVNLVALFAACREAARVMIPAGRGSIVNVASALGLVGLGCTPQASYTASKGGVVNLTRELAAQWSRHGVLLFLASDASSYVCGQTITVDGGWTAV